ncbi:MAG: TetR/AcrR family transcriptional regulator [Methylococcales bacterium]|nr:TetR/AcrR family transcriptional regulator [Methylococcales bacterium]MBT7444945.1 TetR/AcrR family transcriptional regulator [Methylococcales bacterium]
MQKRLSAAARKATILAVAKVLFSEKGFYGVSVDDIAKKLGVSPAILYRHFASKEDLYQSVLHDIASQRENYVEAIVKSDDSFYEVLKNITHSYVDSVATDPDYLRMEMQSALEGNHVTQQFFENRWQPFLDYVEITLCELAPQNDAFNVHPRIASLLFQGIIREVLYAKCIYESDRYRDFELHDLVDHVLVLFFNAIGYREQK